MIAHDVFTASARRALGVICGRAFVPVCVALALVVRVAWVVTVAAPPVSDAAWYFDHGVRLAAGEGYTVTDDGLPMGRAGAALERPRPTAFWPIGYPAFLGAVFAVMPKAARPLTIAVAANVLLSVATIGVIAYCASLFARFGIAARLAVLLLALHPNQIAYTAFVLAEVWFAFLLAVGVAMMMWAIEHRCNPISRWMWMLAGGVFGAAVLTKPQILLLPAALIAVLAWKRATPAQTAGWALTLYATVALSLMPWTIRNYRAFGTFVFVSNNGGVNLLIGNTAGPWRSNAFVWTETLRHIAKSRMGEVERDREARIAALESIASQPLTALGMLPGKLASLYAFDVDGLGTAQASRPDSLPEWSWTALRVVAQLYYLLIVVAAAAALWRWRDSTSSRVLATLVAYFSLVSLVFFGSPRFHFPLVPWLVLEASKAMASGLVSVSTSGSRRASDAEGMAMSSVAV